MKSLDLSSKIVALVVGLLLLLAIVSQIFFTRQENSALETRMREKATFVNTFYAFLIADSLARKDDITLSQVINRLEEDPEITSVVVVDQRGTVRYNADSDKIGSVTEDPLVRNILQSGDGVMTDFQNSGGRALAIVSPLKVAGISGAIGCVRIDMTYRHIQDQIASSRKGFVFAIVGMFAFAVGAVMTCSQKWLVLPLQNLKKSIESVNPHLLEANLPESTDPFGQINVALNGLILQFKSELQNAQSDMIDRGEQEKTWAELLMHSFLPDTRILIVDKNNTVLSDTENGNSALPSTAKHLMDLITDTNFANLVATAFQSEGQVVRGPVQFEEKTYQAAVLSVPSQQTQVVKTFIALVPEAA